MHLLQQTADCEVANRHGILCATYPRTNTDRLLGGIRQVSR